MIRTQIDLPDDKYTALKQLAKDKGITFPEIIRECADEAIRTYSYKKKRRKLY